MEGWTTPKAGIVKNGSLLDPKTPGGLWLQRDGSWGPRQTARRFKDSTAASAYAEANPVHDHDGVFDFSARRRLP